MLFPVQPEIYIISFMLKIHQLMYETISCVAREMNAFEI